MSYNTVNHRSRRKERKRINKKYIYILLKPGYKQEGMMKLKAPSEFPLVNMINPQMIRTELKLKLCRPEQHFTMVS